jgi:hypothetical protein
MKAAKPKTARRQTQTREENAVATEAPTSHEMKELATPDAKELAEMFLLQQDLASSFQAMKLWHERYWRKENPTPEDTLIANSLFRDAILQFIGCFDRTAQYRLSVQDVYKSTQGATEYFSWLQDIRDAYIAHKFGPDRQCAVGVFSDSKGTVISIGHFVSVYAGPSEGARDLIEFIAIAGRYLNSRIEDLHAQVLAAAKAMSKEDLNALPIARAYGVGPNDTRMSREKFKRSRSR